MQKTLIYAGLLIGSTIGGLVASAFGAGWLSFTNLLVSSAGGVVGVLIGFKLGQDL